MEITSKNEIITEQPRSGILKSSVSPEIQAVHRSENLSQPKIKSELIERLELLRNYDTLIVKQELDVIGSVFSCCDKLNKYKIKDSKGKTVLTAIEGKSYGKFLYKS